MRTERAKLKRAIERLEKREWCADATVALDAARKHLATLPKPPRKVKITLYACVLNDGCTYGFYGTRAEADSWVEYHAGRGTVVELTGEYEVPE